MATELLKNRTFFREKDGVWNPVEFNALLDGDRFRVFEHGMFLGMFEAHSNAYPETDTGKWAITTVIYRK